MPWQPLLDGQLAATARSAIVEIATRLATDVPETDLAAAVLFHAYAAGVDDSAQADARYAESTERLVERIDHAYVSDGLFGGLAGDGWVLAHVSDGGGPLPAIDRILLEQLAVARWDRPLGLVDGLAGIGTYFVERAAQDRDAESAQAGLARVVEHLDALHVARPHGLTWQTDPEHIALGLAHGVAGIVALLGRVASPAATRLRTRSERWLWAQQLPAFPRNRFARIAGESRPARTAWCTGDLGIAMALWSNARSVAPARELAREIAMRASEHFGVDSAGLCHGSLGIAHMMNRFYQSSRDPLFARAAIDWFERGLDELPVGWSLLEGLAGAGLALVAACYPSEPLWDRMLGCDLSVH